MPYLEEGVSHLDSESFCLIASGHGATVIIRQNNDRLSIKIRSEDSLARDEKVIAVSQGKHNYIFLMT